MTLNHQNNAIMGFFQSKFREKEVLHTFLASFVTDDIFLHLIDRKMDLLTLTMTSNNRLISEMDYPVKIT